MRMTLTWTIAHSPEQAIVTVTSEGSVTAQSADRLVAELASLGLPPGTGILVDHRRSELEFDSWEVFDRPETYEKHADARRYPVAMVFPKIGETHQFYETVCRNRGFPVSVFADYDKAMDWLATHTDAGAGSATSKT
jgi:hypothetical protein